VKKADASELGGGLYTLPADIRPLSAARGTILALDWRAFRQLGFYDAYVEAMPAPLWAALSAVTAGSWVPLDLVVEHYRVLDGLGLDEKVMRTVGRIVGENVHGAFLATLIRLVGKAGIVSPWLALEQTYKLWTRSWQGGAATVHRQGESAARVTIIEASICSSDFFCASFSGAVAAGVAPFGKGTDVQIIPTSRTGSSVAFRVTWNR
jgi:hypothetical protein